MKKNCSEIFSVLSLLSRHFAQKVHIIYAFLQQSKSIIFSRPFVNRDISVGSPRRPSSGKSWLREDPDSILLNKFCPKKTKIFLYCLLLRYVIFDFFFVWGELDNHYTTETLIRQFWLFKIIVVSKEVMLHLWLNFLYRIAYKI